MIIIIMIIKRQEVPTHYIYMARQKTVDIIIFNEVF